MMATIHDFHAHISFDPDQVEQARAFGASLQQRFGVPLGHFHRARSDRIRAVRVRSRSRPGGSATSQPGSA